MTGKIDFEARREQAAAARDRARDDAFEEFDSTQPKTNGDEKFYADLGMPGFASFTKALAHDEKGLVHPKSFQSLLDAIQVGTQAAFEKVKLGGCVRLLANPLNAYSFQLIGNDSNGARMAAAPGFRSRNSAVDLVERYWMALSRDVPFDRYDSSDLIAAACDDLNALDFDSEFGFTCTPQTIFRGPYRGCDVGPHVSQFLLQDYVFGNQPIRQLQRYPRPGLDYLTDLPTWLKVNNGDIDPTGNDILDGTRYITTLRDAGQWVHVDLPFQSGLWSTLTLFGLCAQLSDANPYASGAITTAEAFGSLGAPDVAIHSGLAAVYGLKHAWFQKWLVHRRLRPEVYAQRLELFRRDILGKGQGKPFKDPEFLKFFGEESAAVWEQTAVLKRIFEHNRQQNAEQSRNDGGTVLLPIAFPEGSPTHPAYPGGHSAFIAAAATIAKAFFADTEISNPKVPIQGGEALGDFKAPAGEPPLTVHGELNKLIANVTLFRDGAGMHWRTDGTSFGPNAESQTPTGGNLLGEALAVSILRDLKETYREEVGTFEFEGIGGNRITV